MNIAELRRIHGVSQKWLADRLGVDVSLVSKMEKGSRQVGDEIKARIEGVFAELPQEAPASGGGKERIELTGPHSPRFMVALRILSGMVGNVDIYGADRPGYYDRVVNAAFVLADKMLERGE